MVTVIKLQERRIITPSTGSWEYQPQTLAANVAPYRFVTPYLRVVRDPANAKAPSTTVTLGFATAAILDSPDDSSAWGERFVDVDSGYTIEIPTTATYSAGSATNGATFVKGITNGKVDPLENPGGLLIWRVQANASGIVLMVEIDLVCRE